MKLTQCTEELFLSDVAKHELIIIRDEGVSRHIRLKKPGSGSMHFDLITWPGYLAYTGDMGYYVFQRLEDMFQFFRGDRINVGYWSEKLQAVDKNGGAHEFDPDHFTQVVNEYRIEWIREAQRHGSLTKEERRELWEAVSLDVLDKLEEGSSGQVAMHAAYDFHHRPSSDATRYFSFTDLFEHRFERPTFHFEWCCRAIQWGISKYDQHKDAIKASATLNTEDPDHGESI